MIKNLFLKRYYIVIINIMHYLLLPCLALLKKVLFNFQHFSLFSQITIFYIIILFYISIKLLENCNFNNIFNNVMKSIEFNSNNIYNYIRMYEASP